MLVLVVEIEVEVVVRLVLVVLELDFDFQSKEEARAIMFQAQDLFRNWNYAATDSSEYKDFVEKIDAFVAAKGRDGEMTNDE